MGCDDVAGPAVPRVALVKVEPVRTCRIGVELDRRPQRKPGRLKSERKTPAAREQIQQSRFAARTNPRNFPMNSFPTHFRPPSSFGKSQRELRFITVPLDKLHRGRPESPKPFGRYSAPTAYIVLADFPPGPDRTYSEQNLRRSSPISAKPGHGGVAILVGVKTDPHRTVRVNVTLPADVLELIDTFAERRGYTRSGFLAQAAKRVIEEEERAAA